MESGSLVPPAGGNFLCPGSARRGNVGVSSGRRGMGVKVSTCDIVGRGFAFNFSHLGQIII